MEVSINPAIELPELTWDWEIDSWRAQKKLVSTKTQEKEQWPQKRLTQTFLGVSRSLQWKHGSVVACCRIGGIECSNVSMGIFEGGCHYLHYLHHSLVPGKYADDTTLIAESEEELKSLLMKVKKESEKIDLKLNIKKKRSWHLVPSFHGK